MTTLIKNAHLVDPANQTATQIGELCNIYIVGGRISAISRSLASINPAKTKIKKEIDAQGCYVLPGIIDLCARLREPGQEHTSNIKSETRAAVSGGITRMICPPDTFPVIDTPAMAHMIQDRANEAGYAKVHPLGALTLGLKGERLTDMAMLIDARCVGLSNALQSVENTLVMRRAMQYASTYGITVFLTPRDPWLQGNGVVHEGTISTMLGLPAIPEAAETVGVARDLALIETAGVTAHFDLISCRRSVFKINEAQKRNVPVTASVAIHHLLCTENDIGAFDTRYKVMPPFRTQKDRDGLINAVNGGQIAAICSDHQPHGADAKLAPFSEAAVGIAGLDTLLSLTYGLVKNGKINLHTAISALTINPAKIAGIAAGSLGIGDQADLCLFDPEEQWTLCDTNMKSNGRNSPFMNTPLQGKVKMTLIAGKTVYTEPFQK